jgi:hypothetical protein
MIKRILVPNILIIFKGKLNFLDSSSRNTQISIFMINRPVGADSWTYMTKLTISDPMSHLVRYYDFPVPDAFLNHYNVTNLIHIHLHNHFIVS